MRDLVRLKIYSVANFAKVEAYWEIGKKYCRKARQPYRRIRDKSFKRAF